MNEDDIRKVLENMNDSSAIDYFKNENNVSNKIKIVKNMSLDQIILLIKNNQNRGINDVKLYLNKLDDDKLVDVINKLTLDELKIIFEKPINSALDQFANGRQALIDKLKNKGLTTEAMLNFKTLGFNDFDSEIIAKSNPVQATNKTIDINLAIMERNNIKIAFNKYQKKVGALDELSYNELIAYLNSNELDRLLKRINNVVNVNNIDKSDLKKYSNLISSLLAMQQNVINMKNKMQLKLKDKEKEINDVNKNIQRINKEISKLKNEISNITDPNEKNRKNNELLKLEAEKDDLIDLYNYLYQGDKYLQGKTFLNKNKKVPQSIKSKITKPTQQTKPTNKSQATASNPSQPVPAQQPQPASVNPSQPVPTQPPQTVPNSIKYYIETGDLPNTLTESEYLELANALSIPANNDINYVLNKSELERLLTSKKVMMAIINQTTKTAHNNSINEYDKLIQEYKRILSDMNIYSASKKERKSIEDMINNLTSLKSKYESSVNGLGFDSLKEYVNFGDEKAKQQNNQNKRVEKVSNKINKNEEILKERYRLLKELEEKRAKNPKFKDSKIEKRIEVLNRQIKELQRKQVNLNKTQTMIVNKNTRKYIATVSEKQQRYNDEQRLASAHAEKMIDIQYKESQLKDEKEKLKNDIKTMGSDKEQKRQAKRDIAKINSKIVALKLKAGYCSLENQVCKGVASSYAK